MQNQCSQHEFSTGLLREIEQHSSTYNAICQYAHHCGILQQIQPLSIFTKSSCDVECNIVFCYHSQNYIHNKKQQIKSYIIRTLSDQFPKLKNKFSIAYIHGTISNFLFFRSIVKMLPANYLKKLKYFYIVQAGILVKFIQLFSFGEVNHYLKSKTVHLHNVMEIQTNLKITLGVNKSKLKLKKNEQNIALTKEMQPSDATLIRNKMYGKQLDEYQQSQTGIQKSPTIPKIIKTLIGRLYSQPTFLKSQGIMRKSCDVEQLQILQKQIMQNKQWESFIYQYQNPYVICGCVKKIFNNLNSPLFSYQIYDLIFAYRSDNHLDNDIKFLQDCLKKMKKQNYSLLCYTISFLIKGIIIQKQNNKMSSYNLAVVFGPCFFRPKQYKIDDLLHSGKFSFMIKMLLDQFQNVVQNAKEFYQLLDEQKKQLSSL